MKTRLFIILLLLPFFAMAESVNVNVYNPNPVTVKNAPVVIHLKDYPVLANCSVKHTAVFVDGKQISCELDDMNKDGKPDDLVFLLTLRPKENKTVTVENLAQIFLEHFPTEMYTDLIVEQKDGSHKFVDQISSTKNNMYNVMYHHGVAFESTIIGYRLYFDNKSTIDVYGKKKQQLELATTGWYPTDAQAAAGYGDDNLRVNGTVGVGTVKGWNGTKALHINKFDKRTQRIVAKGKLRTVVESEVDGWQYEGKKIDMTVRYIMYARHRDVECDVTASQDIKNLATGVEIIKSGPIFKEGKTLVGSWGTDYPVTDTVKYAKQSLGLGVYVPMKYADKQVTHGDNNLIIFSYKKGETLKFHLTAVCAKEEKCNIKSAASFFDYLKEWKETLQPVQVSIK